MIAPRSLGVITGPPRGGRRISARPSRLSDRREHPGIVPIHEAGSWPDGTPFYAMKLVSGRPLCERTTVEERIGLFHHIIAVADAIAYITYAKRLRAALKVMEV